MLRSLLLLSVFFLSYLSIHAQEFSDPLLITMNQEKGFENIDLIADGKLKFAIVEFLEHEIGDQIFFNDEPVFEFEKLYNTSIFNDAAIVFELSSDNKYIDHQVIVDSVYHFSNLKIRQGKAFYQVSDKIYTFKNEHPELFYDLKLENAVLFDYDIRGRKLFIAGGFTGKQSSMQLRNHIFSNDIVVKDECNGDYSNEPNFYASINTDTDQINYYFKEENKCKEAESAKMKIGPNGIYYAFSDHGETIILNDSIIEYNEENDLDEKDSYLFRIDPEGEILGIQTYRNICEDNLHDVIPHPDSSYSVINQVFRCLFYDIQNNPAPLDTQALHYPIFFAQYDFKQNYLWHHRVGKRKKFMPANYLFNTENTFRIAFEIHKNIDNNDEEYAYDNVLFEWDTFGVVKIFDFDIFTGQLIDSSITIQNNHLVHLNDAIDYQGISTYNLTFFDFAPSLLADSIPYNLPLNEELIVNIIYGTETAINQSVTSSTSVKLYPNPVTDENQLFIKTNFDLHHYQIHDHLGRKIQASTLSNNMIELEDISEGLYFISFFKNKELIVTKKFIKV